MRDRTSLVVPLVSHGVLRGDLVCHWSYQRASLFLISVLGEDFSVTALTGYGNHARVRLRIERFASVTKFEARPS